MLPDQVLGQEICSIMSSNCLDQPHCWSGSMLDQPTKHTQCWLKLTRCILVEGVPGQPRGWLSCWLAQHVGFRQAKKGFTYFFACSVLKSKFSFCQKSDSHRSRIHAATGRCFLCFSDKSPVLTKCIKKSGEFSWSKVAQRSSGLTKKTCSSSALALPYFSRLLKLSVTLKVLELTCSYAKWAFYSLFQWEVKKRKLELFCLWLSSMH